jgi:hypothetical protein
MEFLLIYKSRMVQVKASIEINMTSSAVQHLANYVHAITQGGSVRVLLMRIDTV